MKVKNAKGTSRWTKPSTGDESWLSYWERMAGQKATYCGSNDCHCFSRENLVGAHVQKMGSNELFITPLCKACNNREGYFEVCTELVRVPSGY